MTNVRVEKRKYFPQFMREEENLSSSTSNAGGLQTSISSRQYFGNTCWSEIRKKNKIEKNEKVSSHIRRNFSWLYV